MSLESLAEMIPIAGPIVGFAVKLGDLIADLIASKDAEKRAQLIAEANLLTDQFGAELTKLDVKHELRLALNFARAVDAARAAGADVSKYEAAVGFIKLIERKAPPLDP